jgi:hypothetical protein
MSSLPITRLIRPYDRAPLRTRDEACAHLITLPCRLSRMTLFAAISEILLSGGSPHAAPLPKIDAVVTMNEDFFGCHSIDDLGHVVNLDWVKNDKAGSVAYASDHCVVLHKGDQFKVQNLSSVHGAVCLRRTQSSDCYWTNAQMLKSP